jgi:hypothetical protein
MCKALGLICTTEKKEGRKEGGKEGRKEERKEERKRKKEYCFSFFQKGCTILNSHEQFIRDPISPHPHPVFGVTIIFKFDILILILYYHINLHSLMPNDIELLFSA